MTVETVSKSVILFQKNVLIDLVTSLYRAVQNKCRVIIINGWKVHQK